jgi:GNAT superfamily N-acetyltransferase
VSRPHAHRIRPATPADDAAIQALFERAITCARWIPEDAPRDTDFKRNSGGESVFVCCTDDDRVTGLLSVYVGGAFIHHLYVDPAHQGQGTGAALLDSLKTWLPQPWRLKCVVANAPARAFYARLGWVEIETNVGSQGPYVVLRLGEPAAHAAPTQTHPRTAQVLAAQAATARRRSGKPRR